jgi:hypothetical protein
LSVLVICLAALSALMHPGSAAVDLATIATAATIPAMARTDTTMPTIDKVLPAPARAFDLVRPMIEKIKPRSGARKASMMPAIAKPLLRFGGGG